MCQLNFWKFSLLKCQLCPSVNLCHWLYNIYTFHSQPEESKRSSIQYSCIKTQFFEGQHFLYFQINYVCNSKVKQSLARQDHWKCTTNILNSLLFVFMSYNWTAIAKLCVCTWPLNSHQQNWSNMTYMMDLECWRQSNEIWT